MGMVSIVDEKEGVTGVEIRVALSVSRILLLSTFGMNRSTSSSSSSYSCISDLVYPEVADAENKNLYNCQLMISPVLRMKSCRNLIGLQLLYFFFPADLSNSF